MAFVYYNFSDDDNICFADRSDYADQWIFKKAFSGIVPSMLYEAKWRLQLSFLLYIAFFKEKTRVEWRMSQISSWNMVLKILGLVYWFHNTKRFEIEIYNIFGNILWNFFSKKPLLFFLR